MPEERVRLVDYDAAWPTMFEAERELLEDVLRPWLAGPIEHIGSTAIPAAAVTESVAAVVVPESVLGVSVAVSPAGA